MTTDKNSSLRSLGLAAALAAVALTSACAQGGALQEGEGANAGADALSQLVWPMSAWVTQNSAPPPGHPGIDLGAPVGTPIYAAASGTVVTPFYDPGGYGCNVVINHTGGGSLGSGIVTIYGHMSEIYVDAGRPIDAGTLIGKSGGAAGAACSGNSTGAHLHFEIREDGDSIRGWDGSAPVGTNVAANTPIDTNIAGLPDSQSCDEACGNFGCGCVDGQCNGGFCPGTGCTQEETDNCGAFGVNCVDHQCSGGFGPGTGCTARETLDCGHFGVNCVDHQCSGGFGPGSGCTARETLDCGNYGVNCVDHKCSGGFGEGSGCTARETLDCDAQGCGCADHACGGGACGGTGCTAHEAGVCSDQGQSCEEGACH